MAKTGEHGTRVFPDQGAKLAYLIRERGDQRTPSRQNRHVALGERVTRNGADYPSPIVHNQDLLAQALVVHASTVGRWIKEELRIPFEYLTEICRIFAVDETAFKEQGLTAFRETCRAAAPVPARADWRQMLRHAVPGTGRILLRDPARNTGPLRYAGIPADDPTDDPVPAVPAGAPFWMEFVSPLGAHDKPLWAGWHLLLFNHDLTRQGFRCLLPAYGRHTAFATATFPERRALDLPRKPVLTHPDGDVGNFEMVLVVSHAPIPVAVIEPLSSINAHGLAIEGPLRQLAEWIEPRLAQGRIAVARAPYRVIAPAVQRMDASA